MGGALLLNFVRLLLMAVWLLVLGRIVMSWIDPAGRNQLSRLLIQATEPILGPVRRMLPPTGMIDWSGFLVLIVLGALWRAF
ncbi:MAG: YggT family protein [Chloroflexi bacterium]|nr:YggT family protein [Chloroflexota bacterium]